jgi:hypothetical protein
VNRFTGHSDVVTTNNYNIVMCGLKAGTRASARSCGNTKYTFTLGSDGAFGDISMVTTF